MITYKHVVQVLLDGESVGIMKEVKVDEPTTGWQYIPNGQKVGGRICQSFAECKREVEGD